MGQTRKCIHQFFESIFETGPKTVNMAILLTRVGSLSTVLKSSTRMVQSQKWNNEAISKSGHTFRSLSHDPDHCSDLSQWPCYQWNPSASPLSLLSVPRLCWLHCHLLCLPISSPLSYQLQCHNIKNEAAKSPADDLMSFQFHLQPLVISLPSNALSIVIRPWLPLISVHPQQVEMCPLTSWMKSPSILLQQCPSWSTHPSFGSNSVLQTNSQLASPLLSVHSCQSTLHP